MDGNHNHNHNDDNDDDNAWRLLNSLRAQGIDPTEGMDPATMLRALLGDMGPDDDRGAASATTTAPSLRDRDIFKCPVCNRQHVHTAASSSGNLRHQVSHGAIMVFIQADCPVCMEDQVGPPTVALACGHVLCQDDFMKLGGRVGQAAVDPFSPAVAAAPRTAMLPSNGEGMRLLLSQMGAADDDDDDDENDLDFEADYLSDSTSSSMPRLLPRRRAQDNPNNGNANTNNENDNDSDDDSMPQLVSRPNHAESSDDDDDDDNDDDESARPLHARLTINHNNNANSDDSDDDSLPSLVQRPHVDSSSDDEDDEDNEDASDDDSLPNLLFQPAGPGENDYPIDDDEDDSDDDSDESMPGLLPRQRLSDSNHDPDDSTDDSDDDMPMLVPRPNPNANATPTAAASGLEDPNAFASGLRRGFLSGNNTNNNRTNSSTNRNNNSSNTNTTSNATPAANTSRNQARRQPPQPVEDILPSLVDRHSFGSRRVHEQRIADQLARRKAEQQLQRQQELAKQSRQTIQQWVYKNCAKQKCQRQYQHTRHSCIRLQAWGRQLLVKAKYHQVLQTRIAQSRRYRSLWNQVLRISLPSMIANHNHNNKEQLELSWEDIKAKRFDMMQSLEDTDALAVETNEKLDSAIRTALLNDDNDDDDDEEFHDAHQVHQDQNDNETPSPSPTTMTLPKPLQVPPRPPCDHIQLTKEVLKWLDRADSKYRGFFLGRLTQLANGDRSRILKKSLTGCQTAIWETYLDMKSGQRILWTECKCTNTNTNTNTNTSTNTNTTQVDTGHGGNQQQQQQQGMVTNNTTTRGLLIWYVAKHDDVSKLIRFIDSAQERSQRKLTSATTLFQSDENDVLHFDNSSRILPDPMGDTPLKIHILQREELPKLSNKDWKPSLYLTAQEQDIVKKPGTVLLLGRSGTGKTICISNRMERDRKNLEYDYTNENDQSTFVLKQLFVARSKRICKYVRGLVESGSDNNRAKEGTDYLTHLALLQQCHSKLGVTNRLFQDHVRHVDFMKFKTQIYKATTGGLDALVVWSQIRSFIKGSIESVNEIRPLTEQEYLKMGENRCRLSKEQRQQAYASYLKYQECLSSEGMWDDCDRVSAILKSIQSADRIFHQEKLLYDRVYVDEIQDYTQAEIAIFFLLCGKGGLFLAGDTAQSVVEGVEFRFEEVRSVAHALYAGDPRYIPDKPVTVNLNFRSHSGILNTAASVLERMFAFFPRSANRLSPDVGAFAGPRPGIFHDISSDRLTELVSRIDGVVLLTHDDHVSALQALVGNTTLVFGIRDSKGLEFPHVIIVDFFSKLAPEHQKPWRELLTIRELQADASTNSRVKTAVPEVETQLKLLYTAITRCSKRLFFAETSTGIASNAFTKWATFQKHGQPSLCVKQVVDDVERMVKTADEWRSSGVGFGMEADNVEDPEQALKWLTRAIYDLERGGDAELQRKAERHAASVEFRMNLATYYQGVSLDRDTVEQKGAEILSLLIEDNLYPEARKMCDMLLPLLEDYSRERVAREVVAQLPSDD